MRDQPIINQVSTTVRVLYLSTLQGSCHVVTTHNYQYAQHNLFRHFYPRPSHRMHFSIPFNPLEDPAISMAHSPTSNAYGGLPDVTVESGNTACSPLLLPSPTFSSSDLFDFKSHEDDLTTPQCFDPLKNPPLRSPEQQAPFGIDTRPEADHFRAASSEMVSPSDILLFQPHDPTDLDTSVKSSLTTGDVVAEHWNESDIPQHPGMSSLQSVVLKIGADAISASECHRINYDVT